MIGVGCGGLAAVGWDSGLRRSLLRRSWQQMWIDQQHYGCKVECMLKESS